MVYYGSVSYTHLDVYKRQAEYLAEKTGTSWKGKLKIAVDALIPQVSSFEELLSRLQAAGYAIKPGKYVSCRAPGQERFTRLKTLGADSVSYTHLDVYKRQTLLFRLLAIIIIPANITNKNKIIADI